MAWLGPAIGPKHYEVGVDVFEALIQDRPEAADCFEPTRKNHWNADLAGLARQQLRNLGLSSISGGQCCTAAEPERFFSYRRDRATGRMAALIWIKKEQ